MPPEKKDKKKVEDGKMGECRHTIERYGVKA